MFFLIIVEITLMKGLKDLIMVSKRLKKLEILNEMFITQMYHHLNSHEK